MGEIKQASIVRKEMACIMSVNSVDFKRRASIIAILIENASRNGNFKEKVSLGDNEVIDNLIISELKEKGYKVELDSHYIKIEWRE